MSARSREVSPQCPDCDGVDRVLCVRCGQSGVAPVIEGVGICHDGRGGGCGLPWHECECCEATAPDALDVAAGDAEDPEAIDYDSPVRSWERSGAGERR